MSPKTFLLFLKLNDFQFQDFLSEKAAAAAATSCALKIKAIVSCFLSFKTRVVEEEERAASLEKQQKFSRYKVHPWGASTTTFKDSSAAVSKRASQELC